MNYKRIIEMDERTRKREEQGETMRVLWWWKNLGSFGFEIARLGFYIDFFRYPYWGFFCRTRANIYRGHIFKPWTWRNIGRKYEYEG